MAEVTGERPADDREPRLDVRAGLAAIVVGALAGGLAAGFRVALVSAEHLHNRMVAWLGPYEIAGWAALAVLAGALGGIARFLVEFFAPETAGSGIPGVKSRLGGDAPLDWRRILPVKFIGGLAALATGMSLGREGPTVQMGAAVGEAVAEGVGRSKRVTKALVAAGAGAGLTGAFSAPLAGFLFIIEELGWEISILTYTTGLLATLSAQVVIRSCFGNQPLFGSSDWQPLAFSRLPFAIACGVVGGFAGVLYNRSILFFLDLFDRWRSVPGWVHGASAGVLAVVVAYWMPGALFGGDPVAGELTRGAVGDLVHVQSAAPGGALLVAAGPVAVLLLLAAAKLLLTSVSYGSGVVGGLFAPQLVLGATLGAAVGLAAEAFLPGEGLVAIMAGVGAVSVFTASVRVPATGVVLLLEMIGGVNPTLPLALGAVTAFLIATAIGNVPIYEALEERLSRRER